MTKIKVQIRVDAPDGVMPLSLRFIRVAVTREDGSSEEMQNLPPQEVMPDLRERYELTLEDDAALSTAIKAGRSHGPVAAVLRQEDD